ncbi:MAG TPA: cytochrome c [Steroidobacteraceae bacterium]|jgi:mono/diheme cytochrome c family protein|nr:cytochrome c [Steroidobacteraceae bacterium]
MIRQKGRYTIGGVVSALIAIGFVWSVVLDAPARADTAGIFDSTPFGTTDGRQIYQRICQGCHMADGRGAVGAGRYPALAKDLALSSRQYMALTILAGRRNMPAFGVKHAIGFDGPPMTLSDTQIAAVINYVRTHFENHYKDSITPAEVTALDQTAH